MAAAKMSKNQMRRAKKKEQKKAQQEAKDIKQESEAPEEDEPELEPSQPDAEFKVKDEPAPATIDVVDDAFTEDPAFAMYRDVFSKFGASLEEDAVAREANAGNQGDVFFEGDGDIPDEDDETGVATRLSKKKRKQLNKLSVAELKALVRIPEVVEWQDVSSSDPRLLVQIKAQRNVVPVPTHWSLKREYLSSKRGIEKAAFRLPQFIAETGIAEMRDAVLEKQAEQTLKQKQRERVAPKMGKLDIDYQKLYDAFFRFQTKPELTRFGEVYYEGKESEVDFQHFRPGDLSEATREALGMPAGAPPPWLINQQRIGTPPSYPTLKVPGLNAPPPAGGSWGFHPGGWGKPPVNEYNQPLYGGDVFGINPQNAPGQQGGAGAQNQQLTDAAQLAEPVERNLWGELQPREEESEEEEEEESDEEESDDEAEQGGLETPSGLETPGGYASTVNAEYPSHGVETSIAGEMDLRKERRGGYDTEESSGPRSAYTVLQERQVRAEGFFGSDRAYDLSSRPPVLGEESRHHKRKQPGDVDVALDPEALGNMSRDDVRKRYDEGRREEGIGAKWAHEDDLSEMIAQESRKRQKMEQERGDRKKDGGRYRF